MARSNVVTMEIPQASPARCKYEVTRALKSLRKAARLLQVARDAFGYGETQDPDLVAVREVVVTAKEHIIDATGALFPMHPDEPVHDRAQEILRQLYDTLDVVFLVAAALRSRKPPTGEHITLCPMSGGLSVVNDRLERAIAELTELARVQATPQREAAA